MILSGNEYRVQCNKAGREVLTAMKSDRWKARWEMERQREVSIDYLLNRQTEADQHTPQYTEASKL